MDKRKADVFWGPPHKMSSLPLYSCTCEEEEKIRCWKPNFCASSTIKSFFVSRSGYNPRDERGMRETERDVPPISQRERERGRNYKLLLKRVLSPKV